jgi:hypothetical protein
VDEDVNYDLIEVPEDILEIFQKSQELPHLVMMLKQLKQLVMQKSLNVEISLKVEG